MEFAQRYLALEVKSSVQNGQLRYSKKFLFWKSEAMIDLLKVSTKISNEQSINLKFLIPSGILLFLSIFISFDVFAGKNSWGNVLFYLIPGTITLIMALVTYYPSVDMHTEDGSVSFPFLGNRKKSEVTKYIQFVHDERRKRIVEFYTRFSRSISYDRQLENLIALFQNVLISQEELEGYKSQLDFLFSAKQTDQMV